MPQHRGMLERAIGQERMGGEHPPRGKEEEERLDVGGGCGGVTGKGDII